ncbi:MAG: hypothetical protein RJB11_3406 [Planctomycetota bacterium]|jgi:SAM-dependent methyltransferase
MDIASQSNLAKKLGYLCVDRFLSDPLVVSSLHHCWISGWIDRWDRESEVRLNSQSPNTTVLLGILKGAGVIAQVDGKLTLSAEFRHALAYSDLLYAKLDFCRRILSDIESIGLWVEDPLEFQQHSKLFRSFDYGRCKGIDQESLQSAMQWVRLTTALTRYEAALFLDVVPWNRHQDWLDLGGNSGEFAIQICRQFVDLRATVMDLPAVCELGRKHVESYGMAHRIGFQSGDFVEDRLSGSLDLITFKSVLHDWPNEYAMLLLQKAWDHLPLGGRLVVLERVQIAGDEIPLGFGQAPVWMFWNHYRSPSFYESFVEEHLHANSQVQIIHADMPWMVLQIVKSSS